MPDGITLSNPVVDLAKPPDRNTKGAETPCVAHISFSDFLLLQYCQCLSPANSPVALNAGQSRLVRMRRLDKLISPIPSLRRSTTLLHYIGKQWQDVTDELVKELQKVRLLLK